MAACLRHHSGQKAGQPPTRVLADLVTDFAELRPPLRSSTGRHPHAGVPDRWADGWYGGGSGARPRGRARRPAWSATAVKAAKESGDNQLHAWVLTREAMVPLNYGAPQTVAQLAERARQTAGNGPTAAATLAAAVAARAYARSVAAKATRGL